MNNFRLFKYDIINHILKNNDVLIIKIKLKDSHELKNKDSKNVIINEVNETLKEKTKIIKMNQDLIKSSFTIKILNMPVLISYEDLITKINKKFENFANN